MHGHLPGELLEVVAAVRFRYTIEFFVLKVLFMIKVLSVSFGGFF